MSTLNFLPALPGPPTPAHEWANDTATALDVDPSGSQEESLMSAPTPQVTQNGISTTTNTLPHYPAHPTTPGLDIPGSYPGEPDIPPTDIIDTLRGALPSQGGVQAAGANALETVRGYLPAQEDVKSTGYSMLNAAKQYLPQGVVDRLPETDPRILNASLPTTDNSHPLPGPNTESGVALLPHERQHPDATLTSSTGVIPTSLAGEELSPYAKDLNRGRVTNAQLDALHFNADRTGGSTFPGTSNIFADHTSSSTEPKSTTEAMKEYIPSAEAVAGGAMGLAAAAAAYLPTKEALSGALEGAKGYVMPSGEGVEGAKGYLPAALVSRLPNTTDPVALPSSEGTDGTVLLPEERAHPSEVGLGDGVREVVGGDRVVAANASGISPYAKDLGMSVAAGNTIDALGGGQGSSGPVPSLGSEALSGHRQHPHATDVGAHGTGTVTDHPEWKAPSTSATGGGLASAAGVVGASQPEKATAPATSSVGSGIPEEKRGQNDGYHPAELHPLTTVNDDTLTGADVTHTGVHKTGAHKVATIPGVAVTKDGDSPTKKSGFMNKLKGEIKVMTGKVTHNEEKIEEGRNLMGKEPKSAI